MVQAVAPLDSFPIKPFAFLFSFHFISVHRWRRGTEQTLVVVPREVSNKIYNLLIQLKVPPIF